MSAEPPAETVSRPHPVIVIGASAGGVEALGLLVAQLPADLAAPVVMVLHVSAGPSSLPAILGRAGKLPVHHALDGEAHLPGQIYVAPPDRHLEIHGDALALSGGPRENRVRPSVDVLFRSAAASLGSRTIGVVLTGLLDDGAAGLAAIKRAGGLTVVQDPHDAQSPSMPAAAIAASEVDHVVPLAAMPRLLTRLARGRSFARASDAPGGADPPDPTASDLAHGRLTGLGCPECGGALHEVIDGSVRRYRCYLGHGYSTQALLESHGDELDRALWTAVRILEERVHILRNLADEQDVHGRPLAASSYTFRADELGKHSARLRSLLEAE